MLEECYAKDGKLLVPGNGDSAADARHIVGGLMKNFKLPHRPRLALVKKLVTEDPHSVVLLHKICRESYLQLR